MKEYEVTINCDAMYTAIITADNEEEAQEKGRELFDTDKNKFKVELDENEIWAEEHFTQQNCPHSYVRADNTKKVLLCHDCGKEFKPPTA